MTKKRKAAVQLPSTPSKKQETKREDALSLSRLASFMSLQSALLYICLTRIPQTFVPVPNPLVQEPVQTLAVLSIAFFCTQILTTARFRSWYVQDLEREAKKEGKKATEDGNSFQVQLVASLKTCLTPMQPFVNCFLITLLGAIPLYFAAILLGAPIQE
jgi:hypothetical protein